MRLLPFVELCEKQIHQFALGTDPGPPTGCAERLTARRSGFLVFDRVLEAARHSFFESFVLLYYDFRWKGIIKIILQK